MRRTIISRAMLAVGLSIALLAAAAGTAGAERTISPTSTEFGDVQVGTTSPPQAFTLSVKCNTTTIQPVGLVCFSYDFFFPAISVSPPGDFAQTNNCPPLLIGSTLAGVSCTINTDFTPTSAGPEAAELLTRAAGVTASLSGTGVASPTPATPPIPGPAQPPGGTPPPSDPGAGPTSRLDLAARTQRLKKRLTFFARSNVDSNLVVAGKAIKTTIKKLAARQRTRVRAPLKRSARKRLARRLNKRGKARIKFVGAAIDERGRRADDRVTIRFRR